MIEIPVTVFDCGVFLQGLLSKSGPAVRCLELFETGQIRLVISEEVLSEITDVLSRPKLRQGNPNLTDEKVENLIEMLFLKAKFVKKVPEHFSYSRDPNDEPYLNLAIETEAVFLVSRDNDLLDLMTDSADEAKDFRRRFHKIKIVNPVEFVQIIEKKDLSINS
ncbi:MAG: putative toxin-antitoxin system toxin component, PIN family [Aridibacter sp.]